MRDEDRHLTEMAAGLEQGVPGWRARLETVLETEERLFARFVGFLSAALSRRAPRSSLSVPPASAPAHAGQRRRDPVGRVLLDREDQRGDEATRERGDVMGSWFPARRA